MEKDHMNVTQDLNKILGDHKYPSSRAASVDINKGDSKYPKETPEFLRILDKPNYNNVIHRDPNGRP